MKSLGSSKKLSRPPSNSKNYREQLITGDENEQYGKGFGLNELGQQTGHICGSVEYQRFPQLLVAHCSPDCFYTE